MFELGLFDNNYEEISYEGYKRQQVEFEVVNGKHNLLFNKNIINYPEVPERSITRSTNIKYVGLFQNDNLIKYSILSSGITLSSMLSLYFNKNLFSVEVNERSVLTSDNILLEEYNRLNLAPQNGNIPSGDISGSYPVPTVKDFQYIIGTSTGNTFAQGSIAYSSGTTNGNIFIYVGTTWVPFHL